MLREEKKCLFEHRQRLNERIMNDLRQLNPEVMEAFDERERLRECNRVIEQILLALIILLIATSPAVLEHIAPYL